MGTTDALTDKKEARQTDLEQKKDVRPGSRGPWKLLQSLDVLEVIPDTLHYTT